MVQTPPARRFTADEYDRMIAVGVLKKEEHVELIDGEIVLMEKRTTQHMACVARLTTQFSQIAIPGRALLHVHGPIRLSIDEQPESDVALLRSRTDFYEHARPTTEDVFLLVEVADTSLRYDRNVKLRLYAAAGIPEAWLAVLGSRRRLEVFREPQDGSYQYHQVLPRTATIAPLAFPDLMIPVRAILG